MLIMLRVDRKQFVALLAGFVFAASVMLFKLPAGGSTKIPRAAFVYLVHPGRGEQLSESLQSLQANFFSQHTSYPVLLFHEAAMSNTTQLVPASMAPVVRWVLVSDFNRLPEGYVWEDHPTQIRWYA